MAKGFFSCILFLFLSSLCISTSVEEFQHHEGSLSMKQTQIFISTEREKDQIFLSTNSKTRFNQELDPLSPPIPITNPANFPPYTPTPTTTTSPPPATIPATTPGQTWCVARPGIAVEALQEALDYACGSGAADCSMIQQGGSCYTPNTIENHASCAFNAYFQKNPVPASCDFGGVASPVSTNPSSGSCVYPSSAMETPASSTSTTPPATSTPSMPAMPPASTSSASGATGSSTAAGGYVSPPQDGNTSSNPVYESPPPPSSDTFPAGAVLGSAGNQPPSAIGSFNLVTLSLAGLLVLGI